VIQWYLTILAQSERPCTLRYQPVYEVRQRFRLIRQWVDPYLLQDRRSGVHALVYERVKITVKHADNVFAFPPHHIRAATVTRRPAIQSPEIAGRVRKDRPQSIGRYLNSLLHRSPLSGLLRLRPLSMRVARPCPPNRRTRLRFVH
jgi:hypothetical protein